MKFTALKTDLVGLIGNASHFASSRSQLPILENILIRVKGARVYAMSTNLEISFFGSIGASVMDEGEIALPAKTLLELVSNVNSEKIEFLLKEETVKLSGGNFKANLSGMNTSDFPNVPEKIGKNVVEIDFTEFINGIGKVMFSASRDDTRPVLTGILMIFDTHNLTLVSSDGFRLSQKKMKPISIGKMEGKKLIIPRMIFGEIIKMAKSGEMIKFSYLEDQSQVVFELGDAIVSSRLIEGEFPDFSKIIPDTSSVSVDLAKADLKSALATASIFARDSANVVKLLVEDENGKNGAGLMIYAESARSGTQESFVEGKVEGIGLEISFNYKFIEEYLGAMEGESVLVKLNNANSPGVFCDNDSDYLHLIMPVRAEE